MTDYDGFRVERDEARGVATITLDVARQAQPGLARRAAASSPRPSASSAGTTRVRAVVVTGAGGTFTAGGDIASFLTASVDEMSRLAFNVAAPERCSKPVDGADRGLLPRRRVRALARLRLPHLLATTRSSGCRRSASG